MRPSFFRQLVLFMFIPLFVLNAGEVYLVIGSDTAIWSGMNTGRFNCTYNPALYTDPGANAARVMDPAFRAPMVDSYGQPMKMTWWMMAGNIFRYATNTDMPVPNIMTLYFMKKYYGQEAQLNGDEISLHYHTFFWSDYDQDGIFYWNQAHSFLESKDDFNVTLAQFLLEEDTFPVSFRAGWHYMDNDWQRYLDTRILPFSMHNDWPAHRTYDPEPIDNIFDWSQAPADWVPYRVSTENYQRPGNGPGWEVRSSSFQKTRANDYMDSVFAAAQNGPDQVACFWAHLPETDFPENMQMIDSIAHRAANKYPGVNFRYCTAIEAMQRWLQSGDTTAPVIQFEYQENGNGVYFTIDADGPIFQEQPFVAVKTIYKEYQVLECIPTGENSWRTEQSLPPDEIALAGVTVCDSVGNQTIDKINFLPSVMYFDDQDPQFSTLQGNWQTIDAASWGTSSARASLTATDTARAQWQWLAPQSGYYNLFVQVPAQENPALGIQYIFSTPNQNPDTVQFDLALPAKSWQYVKTIEVTENEACTLQAMASGNGSALNCDVLRVSALVLQKELVIEESVIDIGTVSEQDSSKYALKLVNSGISTLTISDLVVHQNMVQVNTLFPVQISAMSDTTIILDFKAGNVGTVEDSLTIYSDDPHRSELTLAVKAEIVPYFKIMDNEDTANYVELGSWHFSNANIYGPSSRYAMLNQSPKAQAYFHFKPKKSGHYIISEIVPKTVNSTNDALYQVLVNSNTIASHHIDQNAGSGSWIVLDTLYLNKDSEVQLWVTDTGQNTNSQGVVIRTDAVRFQLMDDLIGITENDITGPGSYDLGQNYPNPFNPATTIPYRLARSGQVKLELYNALGQKIKTLVRKVETAGEHCYVLDGSKLASGIYYYRLSSGSFRQIRKLVLLK